MESRVCAALALGRGLAAGLAAVVAGVSTAEAAASQWVPAHAGRARLVAGGGATVPGQALTAGVEIELAEGWKTYWRQPGDAGGVPPNFDWSGSVNAAPTVLYPAPQRMTDKAGDTVGYKGGVVFPVALAVADAAKPVQLRLKLEYGICREICVPVEAAFALDLPAATAEPLPEAILRALARVPSAGGPPSKVPSLVSQLLRLEGDKPTIGFVARYPGTGGHADAFAEAGDGHFVPLPRKDGGLRDGQQAFVIELSPAEVADLKGRTLTVTLVSDEGQAEAHIVVP